MLRTEPTAEASLADMRARIKFGMAIAAMIRMMATTISSSMSEKPSLFPHYREILSFVEFPPGGRG